MVEPACLLHTFIRLGSAHYLKSCFFLFLLHNGCIPGSVEFPVESCFFPGTMANTARFGSTTDPSKTAFVRVHAADEYGGYPVFPTFNSLVQFVKGKFAKRDFCFCHFKDTRANCDPDRLLQCPFDKNHQIRSSRFPYHIIKCRKVSC